MYPIRPLHGFAVLVAYVLLLAGATELPAAFQFEFLQEGTFDILAYIEFPNDPAVTPLEPLPDPPGNQLPPRAYGGR